MLPMLMVFGRYLCQLASEAFYAPLYLGPVWVKGISKGLIPKETFVYLLFGMEE
jgi:hypothetical protein